MLFRLLKIIIVLAVLFFAYRLARSRNIVRGAWFDKLDSQIDEISQKISGKETPNLNMDLEKLGEDGVNQVQILANQAKEAGGVAQEFVQGAVKVDENKDQNVSEKAFEYGRYIYCQEVVKQFEATKQVSN